jgi:hypothetical protein
MYKESTKASKVAALELIEKKENDIKNEEKM